MNKIPHVLRKVVGEARCRFFDWRHGVRTCGATKLSDLTIVVQIRVTEEDITRLIDGAVD